MEVTNMKKKLFFLITFVGMSAALLVGCNSGETHSNRVVTKFLNYDESVLYVTTIPYGTDAEYQGETPTRASSESTVYTFSGWDKVLTNIVEDTTFYAQYSQSVRQYEIKFANYDGTILETQNVEYNSTPAFSKGVPVREADSQYTYTFAGWSPEIGPARSNQTYTAQYSGELNEYTVTWMIDGVATYESYKYGQTPSYNGTTPSKTSDAQYTYSFNRWEPEVKKVTGDAVYTAIFDSTINSYTVTWVVNGVQTSEVYEYGQTPSFKGSTSRAEDAQYTYTFKGWEPEIAQVNGNATYTAIYENNIKSYQVHWIVDGNSTYETYEYGQTPSFEGELIKEDDDQYVYTFDKWEPTISTVTGNQEYTAVFSRETNYNHIYKMTLKNGEYSIDGLLDTSRSSYVVPDTFKGYPITSIGDSVFFNLPITSLTIGNNVRQIGKNSISSLGSLSSLSIPDSLESFGEGTFKNNWGSGNKRPYSFENAYEGGYYYGNSNNPYLLLVGINMDATTVRIHSGCKFSLSLWASNVAHTTEFVVDSGNQYFTAIDKALFSKDGKRFIKYPTALNESYYYVVPSTVTSMDEGCLASTKFIEIDMRPSNLVSISDSCMFGCSSLNLIYLPNNLLKIGNSAFHNCTSLQSLDISGVTEVGEMAFYSCNKLQNLTMTNSIKKIGSSVFSGCSLLSKAIYRNGSYVGTSTNPFFALVGIDYDSQNSGNYTDLIVHSGCVVISPSYPTYSYDPYWDITDISIGSAVQAICPYFADALCTPYICNVTINSGNQYYCSVNNAVYNKTKTELIMTAPGGWNGVVENGVITIKELAFLGFQISYMTIPNSVKVIENQSGTNVSVITYTGTTEEWNQILIESPYTATYDITINCTNGTIKTKNIF